MTIQEAHLEFKFRMDKLDTSNNPNFEPEEVDLLLNIAQDRITKQRYSRNNYKGTSFEEDEKRTEDLKELLRTITSQVTQSTNENSTYYSGSVTLADDHWFIVWERAILYCEACDIGNSVRVNATDTPGGLAIDVEGRYVRVNPITHLKLTDILDDPFAAPDNEKVLRVLYRNKVELLYSSDCTIQYYTYRYIKKPERVSYNGNTTFELSEHLHSEIVDEAVKIALEGIEAKRTQTFTPIIDNNKE